MDLYGKDNKRCGICGVFTHSHSASSFAVFSLFAMSHRGQGGNEIITCDEGIVHTHKDVKYVPHILEKDDVSYLPGSLSIGITCSSPRLQKSGISTSILKTTYGPLAIFHDGRLINSSQLCQELLEQDGGIINTNDSDIIVHMLAKGSSNLIQQIQILMKKIQGSYALVILSRDAVYGVRDPWGLSSLVLGKLGENGYILASESCALTAVNAELIREIQPGEIVCLNADGYKIIQDASIHKTAFCTIEHIYLSSASSVVNDKYIYEIRQALGRQLAIESSVKADLVIPVPYEGTPYAKGFAQETCISYAEGLFKNSYPSCFPYLQENWFKPIDVAIVFNSLANNLIDRSVIMVCDLITHVDVSKGLVQLLRKAGAIQVHIRVACPLSRFPCFLDINRFPYYKEFDSSIPIDELSRHIGADSLAFLSTEGMKKILKSKNSYCDTCFTGKASLH